jgi:hypothetical protein
MDTVSKILVTYGLEFTPQNWLEEYLGLHDLDAPDQSVLDAAPGIVPSDVCAPDGPTSYSVVPTTRYSAPLCGSMPRDTPAALPNSFIPGNACST